MMICLLLADHIVCHAEEQSEEVAIRRRKPPTKQCPPHSSPIFIYVPMYALLHDNKYKYMYLKDGE
jgi:hypothetical protein